MPYSIKTFYLVVLACFFGNESCFCALLSRADRTIVRSVP